ncbi:general stress protein [Pseudonocardia saturnea]
MTTTRAQEHTVRNPGKVVATYRDHAEAQRIVDALADRHFPVGGLAIVGANLQSYEQITGRRGFARAAAAASGLTSGAVTGASPPSPRSAPTAMTCWP